MIYVPNPRDTSAVELPASLWPLIDALAEQLHEVWARRRVAEGWRHGPNRDDAQRLHPCLLPYSELPEAEKAYDRDAAIETLKTITVMGFRIEARLLPPADDTD